MNILLYADAVVKKLTKQFAFSLGPDYGNQSGHPMVCFGEYNYVQKA